MWLHIAFYGGKFQYIPNTLGEYIIENDNISSDSERFHHNQLVVLRNHVYNVQRFESDKDKLWRDIYAGLLISRVKKKLLSKQYLTAMKFIVSALNASIAGSIRYVLFKFLNALS